MVVICGHTFKKFPRIEHLPVHPFFNYSNMYLAKVKLLLQHLLLAGNLVYNACIKFSALAFYAFLAFQFNNAFWTRVRLMLRSASLEGDLSEASTILQCLMANLNKRNKLIR